MFMEVRMKTCIRVDHFDFFGKAILFLFMNNIVMINVFWITFKYLKDFVSPIQN